MDTSKQDLEEAQEMVISNTSNDLEATRQQQQQQQPPPNNKYELTVDEVMEQHIGPLGNPTNLIKGLANVEVLELSSVKTSEMFYYFREAIPVFGNLFRLSITTDLEFYNWKYFPILIMISPNLHTLVIKGPLHADECEGEYGLSCPVKVLKITEYGGKSGELKRMKHLLEKLACLELVKVRACAINDKEKSRITKDLLMVPRSFNCNIQVKFSEKTNYYKHYKQKGGYCYPAMIIQDDPSPDSWH
ncbi:unnamed protein product [Arabidopsis arenosa]|uniref:FBD domain-containing protein n=1 Tax=Arabidopsis arenosa TaxID=38785 RepID=A0A8S1ZG12_ARAAE|nr:unnamed protein product [Arabidopsis arenosa]